MDATTFRKRATLYTNCITLPGFYSTLMETMQKLNFYGGLDIHYITRNITLGLEHDKTTSTDIQNGNTRMVTSFSKE